MDDKDGATPADTTRQDHALFDQTNGISERFAEPDRDDAEDDGNDLDADLGKFTGLGGNTGF